MSGARFGRPMAVQTVAVVGAGQMGSGIAQVCAQAGYQVVLRDVEQRFVDRGLQTIQKSLRKFVEKGKLAASDRDTILSRIRPTVKLEDCYGADLVIEAIIEQPQAKKELFRALDAALAPHAIIASNTSSIPITEMAASTTRPDRFIGMHFMNPVPIMQLIEVIRGLETSDATTASIVEMSRKLGKTAIEVADYPGFATNRILLPFINEAFYAVMEGVATPEAIDQCAKLGLNHPMGPLELADFVGLDTCLYVLEVMHDGFKDPKFRPCPLLRKYVQAGRLGRKVGRGVYDYPK
jgi:3-hydroxybutyryl-CoA dehydrogenase